MICYFICCILYFYYFFHVGFIHTYCSSHFDKLYNAIIEDGGMTISDDGTMRSLPKDVRWIDSSNELLIRDCWKDLFPIILSKNNVILKGKEGRGKSVFILFVIFEILLCAKSKKRSKFCPQANFPSNPRIIYFNCGNKRYLITLDGVFSIPSQGGLLPVAHYCFSDGIDPGEANIGSLLTLAADSGEPNQLKYYWRHYDTLDFDEKATLYMPSLELQEMKLMYPDMDPEELEFKFDVIGGNPRMMWSKGCGNSDSPFVDPIIDVIRLMFGEEYVPTNAETLTKKQALGRWAIDNVVEQLECAMKFPTTNSFFQEYVVSNNYEVAREQCPSKFLSLVGGALFAKFSKGPLEF